MYNGPRGVAKRKDFHAASRELADLRFQAESYGYLPDGIDSLSTRTSSIGRTAISRRGDVGKGRLEAAATRDIHMAALRTKGEFLWPPKDVEVTEAVDPLAELKGSELRDHIFSQAGIRVSVDTSSPEAEDPVVDLYNRLGEHTTAFDWQITGSPNGEPEISVILTPRLGLDYQNSL